MPSGIFHWDPSSFCKRPLQRDDYHFNELLQIGKMMEAVHRKSDEVRVELDESKRLELKRGHIDTRCGRLLTKTSIIALVEQKEDKNCGKGLQGKEKAINNAVKASKDLERKRQKQLPSLEQSLKMGVMRYAGNVAIYRASCRPLHVHRAHAKCSAHQKATQHYTSCASKENDRGDGRQHQSMLVTIVFILILTHRLNQNVCSIISLICHILQ